MSIPSNAQIVFPEAAELVLTKTSRNRTLNLKQLIATIYMFGGISAVIVLLSKFVIQPLYEQLTLDREGYAQLATNKVRDINVLLSKLVSTVPPVKVDRDGKTYCQASTQTEDPKSNKNKKNKQPAPTIPVDPEEKSMSQQLNRLGSNTELQETAATKYALEQLSGLTTTLSFPQYGGKLPNFDLKVKQKDDKLEKDVHGEIMKEIRSIKGSLLSARQISIA